tara:strand:+ start:515 stop:802 length:288 start_codon:yes stop_codon:yes gene_type:complete
MKLISIGPSTKPEKKLMAIFETDTGRKRTTHFGAAHMDDYTLTHDKAQRERYRTRHQKDLNTGDATKAGYLSWYILWNKPTIAASIRDYKKKFNL